MNYKNELKQFIQVRKIESINSKIDRIKKYWNKDIFIPTHGNDGIQYLYYINFMKNSVIKWSININPWVQQVKEQFTQDGWLKNSATEVDLINRRIYSSFTIHNATYSVSENCLYVFPISGNFILRLSIDSDDYAVLGESPYTVLCSTNNLEQNHMYYTVWDIRDSTKRGSTYDNVPVHIHQYNISTGESRIIKSFKGPDTIHQTFYNTATDSLLCVEMPVFLQKAARDADSQKVVNDGVCPSRLIQISLNEPKYIEKYVTKGPAHITLSKFEKGTVFLSCCNMSAASCFGSGRIDKYNLNTGLQLVDSYEAKDLFRIPSISSLIWMGEELLCVAVFPNQVHIINANTMRLIKRIVLSDTLTVPDFSQGSYRYPNYDKTPYTVLTVSESPYIALCTIWSVRILDIRLGRVVEKLIYNKDRDPLITTGHSILIDS